PARVDLARREPEQPPKGAPGDQKAGDDEDRRLAERGEVLGLAVTIGVTRIGGAPGDAERDEGQDRRDEVGSGVRRLREQAETVRGDPCQDLDRDQQAGGDDRDKRGTSLGGHDAEGSHNARGPLSRASRSSWRLPRLCAREVADEDRVDAVGPAVHPVVVKEALSVVALSRVVEAEATAGVAVVARALRRRPEEGGDEVTARALGRAGGRRVEGAARDRALQVAVQPAGLARLERRAVLAAPDDAGTRVGARALTRQRDEVALILTADGVGAVVIEPHLVDAAQRVSRPRTEIAAVIRRGDVEDELAALGIWLVLVAVPRVGETDRRQRKRSDDQYGKNQPTLHVVEITLSWFPLGE